MYARQNASTTVDARDAKDLALAGTLHLQRASTNSLQSRSIWPAIYEPAKSVLDLTLASVMLILAIPVTIFVAIAVKLTSPGPALYTQTRVGKNGRCFRIYKIRTMHHDAEMKSGICWSKPGDSRVTRLGQFLRKTHLDELPQLVNVLRLEMSLVGPRPERPELIPALEDCIPNYRDRLRVRPGVTGLAQLRLPADVDTDSVRRKLEYDLYYIETIGPWIDLRLIGCTILKMLGIPLTGVLWLANVPGESEVGAVHTAGERMSNPLMRLVMSGFLPLLLIGLALLFCTQVLGAW